MHINNHTSNIMGGSSLGSGAASSLHQQSMNPLLNSPLLSLLKQHYQLLDQQIQTFKEIGKQVLDWAARAYA